MANGFYGSKDQWERMIAPLRRLDSELDDFAHLHGIEVERNARNWPGRTLCWGAPIQRLIQINPDDEDGQTWSLGICAYEDRPAGRYGKMSSLKRSVRIDEIEKDLPALLRAAWDCVSAWKAEDLMLGFTTAAPR